MISQAMPAAGVAVEGAPASDRELKFSLPAGQVDLVRRLLESVCRRDPDHPAAIVWTIYYDTADFGSLGEKLNSDYVKSKVRLRWYSSLDGRVSPTAFVEAKMRRGNRREKVRVPAPYPAATIAAWGLQEPRLLALPQLLRPHGIVVRGGWQPMILLRYRRDRFVEPASLARVSLDTDIRATAVNRRFISTLDDTAIGTAVLEIKGGAEDLPLRLRPLIRLGIRQRSFSKYLAVHRHVTRSLS
jgi:hypothetical protein